VSKQLSVAGSANKVQTTAVTAADVDTVAVAADADDADVVTGVEPEVLPSDSDEQLNKPLIGLSLFVPFCLMFLC